MGSCCSHPPQGTVVARLRSGYKVGVKPQGLDPKTGAGSVTRESVPAPPVVLGDVRSSSVGTVTDILGSQLIGGKEERSSSLDKTDTEHPLVDPLHVKAYSNVEECEEITKVTYFKETDQLLPPYLVDRMDEGQDKSLFMIREGQDDTMFWIPDTLARHMGMGGPEREQNRRLYHTWAQVRLVVRNVCLNFFALFFVWYKQWKGRRWW